MEAVGLPLFVFEIWWVLFVAYASSLRRSRERKLEAYATIYLMIEHKLA